MIRAGVMKPAGNGGGDSMGKRRSGGGKDGPVGQANGLVKAGHPGKFLGFGQGFGFSGFNRGDVVIGVDAKKVGAGHRFRTEQADALHLGHPVGDPLEFLHRHGVFADGGGLAGVVERLDHVRVGGTKGTGVGPSG